MGRVLALKTEWGISKPWLGESPVPVKELSFMEVIKHGFPQRNMDKDLRRWKARNLQNLFRGWYRIILARNLGIPHFYTQWCLASISPDGQRKDYGLVSMRVVTTVGAGFVVDAFIGSTVMSNLRFHGLGSGFTVESAGDTALSSEASSAYTPSGTRATGTATEGDSAVIFRTVANTTLTTTVTVSELGLFSQASTSTGSPVGGILFDRGLVSPETFFAQAIVQTDARVTVATGT